MLVTLLFGTALSVLAQTGAAEDYGRFAGAKQLLDAGNYSGAVLAIELEIARAPLRREEGFIYAALAIAAWKSDQTVKAQTATIQAIADEPSAQLPWAILHEMHPTSEAWERMQLPDLVRDETRLLPLLRCDHYAAWPSFAVRGCAAAYRAYAGQLAQAGRTEAATTIRQVALEALVAHASKAYFVQQNVDEADSLMTVAAEIGDLAQAQPDTQTAAWVLLALVDQQKFRFLHAIRDYEHVVGASGEIAAELRPAFGALLQDVYESISWDPETRMLRTQDPDDFFDTMSIDGPPLPTGSKGKRIPYGMTSPDEDSATLGSAGFGIQLLAWLNKPYESIESIVKKRLAQRNFELPVKLIVFTVWTLSLNDQTVAPEMVKQLDAEFARTETAMNAADDVPDSTLVAFEVAKRTWKILTK